MAKNINHIQHVKSNVVLEGKPKLPESGVLVEGELAVNYSDGYETISLENTNNEIITFSSDEYYTEQKLGSGFTGTNSGRTVTDVIVENEEIVSSALNDLNDKIDNLDLGDEIEVNSGDTPAKQTIELWIDESITPIEADVYTKNETSGATQISTALEGKVDVSAYTSYTSSTATEIGSKAAQSDLTTLSGTVTGHTADTTIHLTSTEKEQLHTHSNKTYLDAITGTVGTMAYQNASSYSSATEVNTALAEKVNVADVVSAITSANSASTNPVSVKVVAENELVVSTALNDLNVAISGVNGTLSAHTADTSIHLTSSEKTNIDSLTGTVGTMAYENKTSYSSATEVNTAFGNKADKASAFTDAEYNSTDKKIYFKNSNGTVVDNIDTTDFIKDGMVNNVEVKTVAGSGTCLVISFNTDAGKEDINIPISDIFNASNYYQKSETSGSTELSTAFNAKVNTADIVTAITTANSASTNAVSVGAVVEAINDTEEVITSAIYDINDTLSGHTANTSIHLTSTEKTNLDSLATNIAAISGISSTKVSNWDGAATNSHTHSNKTYLDGITGTVGTMVYQNASSYSSATQVNTALAGKSDTGHTHASSGVTAMTGYAKAASGSSIATGDTLNQAIGKLEAYVDDLNGQSETIAVALNELNTNKLDASALTEVNSAISDLEDIVGSGYTNTTITDVIENMDEAVAAAITDIYDSLSSISPSAITMDGYQMAASGTAITSGDTLNQAIGKLEKQNDEIVDFIEEKELAISASLTDLNDKIGDIESILATI